MAKQFVPARDIPELSTFLKTRKRQRAGSQVSLQALQEVSPLYTNTLAQIAGLTGTWNLVHLYTPDQASLQAERAASREALRANKVYNPRFQYSAHEQFDADTARPQLTLLWNLVDSFPRHSAADFFVFRVLKRKLYDDLATCDIVDGFRRNDEKLIAQGLGKKYPRLNESVFYYVLADYEQRLHRVPPATLTGKLSPHLQQRLQEKQYTAKEIKEAMEWVLRAGGLLREQTPNGFVVVIDPAVTSIDVRDKCAGGPTVYIPADREENLAELLSLLAHEIEGHARQAINGQELLGWGGGPQRLDDEILYEGLGLRYEDAWMQTYFGSDSGGPLPFAGLYYCGVLMAEKGCTFAEILADQFERAVRLDQHLTPPRPVPAYHRLPSEVAERCFQDAWRRTYRVMRGHLTCANRYPFAMRKDLAYVLGWLVDKELQTLGLGHINEIGVLPLDMLPDLATVSINPPDVPHQFTNNTARYLEEVVLPSL